MSDMDILGELGLGDVGAPVAAEPVQAAAETAEEHKERKQRVEVKIAAAVVADDFEEIPAIERAGGGGGDRDSKYSAIEELPAPVKREDGTYGYKPVTYEVGENDPAAFKSAIASAVANLNRKYKKAGEPNVYISRTFIKDDKFLGMKVFRVDDTLKA